MTERYFAAPNKTIANLNEAQMMNKQDLFTTWQRTNHTKQHAILLPRNFGLFMCLCVLCIYNVLSPPPKYHL